MIHLTFESVKSVTALPWIFSDSVLLVIGTTSEGVNKNSLLCKQLSMPGVIFLEHFNCNNLFLSDGCLLMNCVRDNNQGVI